MFDSKEILSSFCDKSYFYVSETGRVFVWGGGSEGQLGLGDVTECPTPTQLKLDEEVVALSCGYYHTALVTGK